MIIGYARVSTEDQNLDLQFDALKKAGCEKIFQDKISGMKEDRDGLSQALEIIRSGDTWKFRCLSDSIPAIFRTAFR